MQYLFGARKYGHYRPLGEQLFFCVRIKFRINEQLFFSGGERFYIKEQMFIKNNSPGLTYEQMFIIITKKEPE